MRSTDIPPAVFLPPAAEQLPDLSVWLPRAEHRAMRFLACDVAEPASTEGW